MWPHSDDHRKVESKSISADPAHLSKAEGANLHLLRETWTRPVSTVSVSLAKALRLFFQHRQLFWKTVGRSKRRRELTRALSAVSGVSAGDTPAQLLSLPWWEKP